MPELIPPKPSVPRGLTTALAGCLLCVSIAAKAQRLLGWQPRVPVQEALRRTLEWVREMETPALDKKALASR